MVRFMSFLVVTTSMVSFGQLSAMNRPIYRPLPSMVSASISKKLFAMTNLGVGSFSPLNFVQSVSSLVSFSSWLLLPSMSRLKVSMLSTLGGVDGLTLIGFGAIAIFVWVLSGFAHDMMGNYFLRLFFGLALIGLAKAALAVFASGTSTTMFRVSLVCRMLNMFCTVQ